MRYTLFLTFIFAFALHAFAEVKREYKTTSTIRRMGTNESVGTDYYSVDKYTGESTTKWSSGFMKTMTRGKDVESANITRIDRDSIYTLDRNKKTYSAMSFAEFREMLKKGMADMENAQPEEDEPDSVAAEDMYEWTVEDLSVDDVKEINGWPCKNAHIVATGVNKHDPNDKVIITLNNWNSEAVPGAAEITEYAKKYLAALGLDQLAMTEGLMTVAMLYADKLNEVLDKAKDAKGEPVQSLLKIEHNRLKGKSVGQIAKEGAAEEIAAKVPFGLGKKKKKEEAKPEYVLKTVFSSERLLQSASTDTVDPANFEVPSDYKLKK
ncbi:MAG: hypothetical protein IPG71_00540 [bacterium]|nr:hypothetical protein [bacterium]